MINEKNKYFGRDEYQNPVIVNSNEGYNRFRKKNFDKKFTKHTIYGELIEKDNFLAA